MSKPEAPRPARIRLPSGGRTKFLARIPNKDVEEFKKVGGEVSMNEALILGFRGWLRKQHQAMSIAAPKTAVTVPAEPEDEEKVRPLTSSVIPGRLDKKSIGARVGPKKKAKARVTINDEEGIG